jgi:RHS repeat-associated protein
MTSNKFATISLQSIRQRKSRVENRRGKRRYKFPAIGWKHTSQMNQIRTLPQFQHGLVSRTQKTLYYDGLNRLTNVTDWAGRQTTNTYDLGSELTTVARPNGTVRTVAYDAAGETTNIVERYATGAMAIEYIAMHWNTAGRTDWEFVAPLPHPYTPPSRTMTCDGDNRLTNFNGSSVTIDNNGNMTYGPGTNNAFSTYTYDARNRLTSAFAVSYGYDPGNNRVALTNGPVAESFVVDPVTSQVLMRIKPGVTNYYVYGNGLLYEVDVTAATNTTLYYHYDSRGSTVALTDATGNITDRMEYTAYGMLTYRFGTNDTPFLYNGRYGVQTDPNGLLFMRARYYNPYICRFINADPSGFGGGLNMYAFADGNPISEMDPFGLGFFQDNPVGVFLSGSASSVGAIGAGLYHGVVQTGAVGSDMIGQTTAAAFGYGGSYQGYSTLYRNIYNNPSAGPTGGQILAGTASAVANVGTLGLVGIGQGLGQGLATGNYTQLGTASVNSLLYSAFAGTQQAAGVNPWTGSGANLPTGMNSIYYEIGQKTFPGSVPDEYAAISDPSARGQAIIDDQGWASALTPQGTGWLLGIGKTFGTGPTPGGWFGVNTLNTMSSTGK